MASRVIKRPLLLFAILATSFLIWGCRHSQDFSQLSKVSFSVHDKETSDIAWIMEMDLQKRRVWVQVDTDKTDIIFLVKDDFLDFYKGRLNSVLPVTFYCNGKPDRNCNLNKPYVLYAGYYQVKLVSIIKHNRNG